MKKLDIFIIKKFLSTFVFSICIFISIVIVFDVSEKIDDFIEKDVPFNAIVFDYYLNFIPYFINMFSPLVVFISVIFFTSRMASNTEFIAFMSGGVSYNRILLPYFICATLLCGVSYYMSGYIIPRANESRLLFQQEYIKARSNPKSLAIHKRLDEGVYAYIGWWNLSLDRGIKFTLEKFEGQKLRSKISSEYLKWDTTKNLWTLKKWQRIEILEDREIITKGSSLDTVLDMHPSEFRRVVSDKDFMNNTDLAEFIKTETERGSERLEFYKVEQYKRNAFPFSTLILTLMGVTLASRKTRGGTGLHIGFGLLLSFSYILLMQVSTTFALYSDSPPLISVWAPNILYMLLGIFLYFKAQK
ncbi:MAG: YjgP/YjgQ family permease [Flavobacteriales bacterium]|nr:YjgP/YjgQ family permease [Flavobacteriales bacterium]